MSRVSRRELLFGSAALLGLPMNEWEAWEKEVLSSSPKTEVGKVDQVSDGVYFYQGNIAQGHCNNGWIIFDDYVLVIDANFPSGALEILPKIRALTDKPIRFAFDTHHHGDHAYGNQVWNENGATPVAHTGVIEEMKKYETGYYGDKPGRWEDTAKQRPDVKASKLKPPSLLFPRELIFDDGKHRVELLHLGVAHTHGDALAWMPKEKILFTGDVCVNGAYNYVGDGNIEKWIATLEAARKLGARIVCPGHGPRDAESLLAEQQKFFRTLRERVGAFVNARKTAEQIRDSVEQIRKEIQADPSIARYVGPSLTAQADKVYQEMTGGKFPASQKSARDARHLHAHAHGHDMIIHI
jgi:cyclase